MSPTYHTTLHALYTYTLSFKIRNLKMATNNDASESPSGEGTRNSPRSDSFFGSRPKRVKLVLAAEKPLLELYAGGRLDFEFQRTISRLQEMQSYEYLAREHRP